MKILSSELSTRHASVALLDDETLLGEETWDEPRAYYETYFQSVTRLLERAGVALGEIDVFAVGRGPGSFSGIRVALTAARAFALPAGKKVFAVSSGEALAHDILKRKPDGTVAIIGDARRAMVWFGSFCHGADSPICVVPWTLFPTSRLDDQFGSVDLAASADWDRIPPTAGNRSVRVHEAAHPTAHAVASLALAKIARGLPSDPPEPLYMHPAV